MLQTGAIPFQMGISELQSMMTFTSLLTFLDFDGFSRKEGEEQKAGFKAGPLQKFVCVGAWFKQRD